jgi:hypothetical protein
VSPTTKRNLIRAPLVLLIRLPIMLPLWLIFKAGQGAEAIMEAIRHKLPGFEREKRR